mmetsp:Transcript_13707/g.35036  ORF Transcript_13707/g.35036 Transcript_13707/m.35036 type:complete len:210 (+) Transcript_13707:348-977(+)
MYLNGCVDGSRPSSGIGSHSSGTGGSPAAAVPQTGRVIFDESTGSQSTAAGAGKRFATPSGSLSSTGVPASTAACSCAIRSGLLPDGFCPRHARCPLSSATFSFPSIVSGSGGADCWAAAAGAAASASSSGSSSSSSPPGARASASASSSSLSIGPSSSSDGRWPRSRSSGSVPSSTSSSAAVAAAAAAASASMRPRRRRVTGGSSHGH